LINARVNNPRHSGEDSTMNNLSYRPEYRRHLPHLQPEGATFFVTFRLIDAVPRVTVKQWQEEKQALELELSSLKEENERAERRRRFHRQRFAQLENLLDSSTDGEHWLKDAALAQIVCEAFHHRDGKEYRLDAFCVMSNHVHALFMPLAQADAEQPVQALQKIMHGLKRFTSLQCNKLLGRGGSFWEAESFDHYCRNHDEWIRVLHYILNNPVKAGIVENWRDFPFSYCSEAALKYVTL